MKRVFLAVVAVLAMTAVNAKVSDNIDFNYTTYQPKLGMYLDLSSEQIDKVSDIQEFFAESIRKAGYNKNEDMREKYVKRAVYANLKLMKDVLDENQYRKYLRVMNAGLRNHGLTAYLDK